MSRRSGEQFRCCRLFQNLALAVMVSITLFLSCSSESGKDTGEAGSESQVATSKIPVIFDIKRGTNISHWLSQSQARGESRKTYFERKDVKFLAGIGFDHLRFPIDEEQMWDEQGNMEAEAFELLNSALDWCAEYNLKAIIDLHIVRAHHFNEENRPLWKDAEAQKNFQKFWRDISSQFKNRPNNMVAYEIMNEPVADDPEDWNKLVAATINTIRGLEPDRIIFVGSNMWNSVNTFDVLRIPENDKNLVLSFHFYIPMPLTHYTAGWTKVGEYTGSVHYPGLTVPENELEGLPDDLVDAIDNRVYNRGVLADLIAQPLAVARKHNLQLHLGEWGCYEPSPVEDRLRWYADVRSICEENNIAWTTWDYKGGFGVVSDGKPVQNLIDTLLK